MTRLPVVFALSLALILPSGNALAQTTAEDRAAMAAATKIFDDMARSSGQLHASTSQTKTPKSDSTFRQTIPMFRKATDNFRQAISGDTDLKEPVRSVNKLIDPLTDYLKAIKLKPTGVDPGEFKDFTHKDLAWETLTTAERVDNNLQISDILLRRIRESGATSIQAMEFFTTIHSDLTRLKWLSAKLASSKPPAKAR